MATAWFYQSELSPDGVNSTDIGPQMKVAVSNTLVQRRATWAPAEIFARGRGRTTQYKNLSGRKHAGILLACPYCYRPTGSHE